MRDALPFETQKLTLAHHKVFSTVAQWLEHPNVVGSNPIWGSDFFPSSLCI